LIVSAIAAFNFPQIVMLKIFEFVFNADPTFGIFFPQYYSLFWAQ